MQQKREKKRRLAFWNRKERRLAKLKVKKRNEGGSLEGLVFLFFFISVQGSNEREYFNRRERFLLFVKLERVPRE